uniref:Uncharacterized protein n=1 Tax=Rhizophora mucronata TaxID=61149 RepID=A0A2P2P9Q1_RHIMU
MDRIVCIHVTMFWSQYLTEMKTIAYVIGINFLLSFL